MSLHINSCEFIGVGVGDLHCKETEHTIYLCECVFRNAGMNVPPNLLVADRVYFYPDGMAIVGRMQFLDGSTFTKYTPLNMVDGLYKLIKAGITDYAEIPVRDLLDRIRPCA